MFNSSSALSGGPKGETGKQQKGNPREEERETTCSSFGEWYLRYLSCWDLKARPGLGAGIDVRALGLCYQLDILDSLDIGVTENWNGNYDKHLGSLWENRA